MVSHRMRFMKMRTHCEASPLPFFLRQVSEDSSIETLHTAVRINFVKKRSSLSAIRKIYSYSFSLHSCLWTALC